jgi:methylated-DNA-protein-cysteine methyltransferase-like protein
MVDGSIACGVFADMRRAILETESVTFLPDGRVDMTLCRWFGNDTDEYKR